MLGPTPLEPDLSLRFSPDTCVSPEIARDAVTPGLDVAHREQSDGEARKTILIVDDNLVNLKILETYMKRRGYVYATAVNGLQAVDTYKKAASELEHVPADSGIEEDYLNQATIRASRARPGPFAFVLMDSKSFAKGDAIENELILIVNMPIMDGLAATRHIRAYERESAIASAHIIALTGLTSAEAQQEAYGSGVDLFLSKPVRLKELMKIMTDYGTSIEESA